MLFASFIAGSRPLELEPIIHPLLRKPLIAYCVLWGLLPPGAFGYFFATFPEPTPLDRRAPWLKVLLIALPLLVGTSFAVATVLSPETPSYVRPGGLSPGAQRWFDFAAGMYSMSGYGLGLASLGWHAFRGKPEARRRTRVMLVGAAGAILPIMIVIWFSVTYRMEIVDFPFWVWVGAILALFLLPLSFAYAVVKHRVMEIPLLIRRSARYILVRHAISTVAIAFGVVLTFAFAAMFSHVPEGLAGVSSAGFSPTASSPSGVTEAQRRALSGVAGAVFGVLITFATRKGVSKITRRLDRAFFREAYDARQLLQDLARQTRGAVDQQQLAELLERSLDTALHPRRILVLLRTPENRLEPIHASPELVGPSLDAALVERESGIRAGVLLVRPGHVAPIACAARRHRAGAAGADAGA